jgi:hypothetical protein
LISSFYFSEIINAIPELDYICVDVANGYSEHFVEFVRLVRKEFPEKTIFVEDFQFFSPIKVLFLIRLEMLLHVKWLKNLFLVEPILLNVE